jgi:uncharacterized membrane protein YjjP (DUF1212 family)
MPTDPSPTPPPQSLDEHKLTPRSIAILVAAGVCLACETALIATGTGTELQATLGGALIVLIPAVAHTLGVDFGRRR